MIDKIPAIKPSGRSFSISAEVVEDIPYGPFLAHCNGEVLLLAILMEIALSFMDEPAILHRYRHDIVRLHGILFLHGLRISKCSLSSTDYALRQGQ